MRLTSAQKQIYDTELVLGGSVNTICGTVLLDKLYNFADMKKAINEVYRINESLRTRISLENNEVTQFVTEFAERKIEILEFSSKEDVHIYANKMAQTPIDILGDLCELKIIKSIDFCGVFYRLHHIISDGWTLALIASHFYKILNGENVEAFPYSSYIDEEEKYLKSNRAVKDKEYFVEQFNRVDDIVFLADTTPSSNESTRKTIVLDKELSSPIIEYTKENDVSAYALFLTLISVYFSKIKKNTEKIYIGTTVLNRTSHNHRNTAGMFVNTVPYLAEFEYDKSFSDNLKNTQENLFGLLRHQKYNYISVLSEISRTNLFDIMFSYQNSTIYGENFESTWYHSGIQNENLHIHIDDRDSEGIFRVHYDYNNQLFSESDIITLHNRLITLVNDAINNPDKPLRQLNCLIAEEKEKVLNTFNNTSHTYNIPNNSTLYSLFEKASEENSDKVCIKANDEEITFKDFKAYAERIDGKVREITKEEKSVIAVICERSFEMYGSIYGIIRGGNAYLPIDPNYPQDRIDYILENSNAKAVVTQDKFCHLAGNTPCINATALLNSTEQPTKTEILATENDTAYVIYTSGSTGNPKGAKISHKSAINRILWMHDFYPLEDNDVILQKTPYTFDVSVWELFWWGITGRALCASKPDEHFLPAKILEEVERNKVTHLHFVPSVFDLFLTYLENNKDEQSKFNSVKYVFLSGEALTANSINRFYNIYDYNKVQLHNLYGPTECAVDVSYYPCVPTDIDPVPIGKPIYNTQLHIVDKYLNPTPIGVVGELCIAGVNVGQGYLNNEQLTNEKFIDNPFGEGKLYKTGDLAYWREDGQICYVGRMDSQIKLNGQRIELGEIEKVISEVSGVESVAVIIKQNNGQDVLVAFCCGDESSINEILKYCESKLPQYMIPSKFVFIEKMPLNPSGKLDRKALKNIDITFDNEVVKEGPITDTEKLICKLFEKTLHIDFVGRNESFFTLGGTSLDMIAILSENELKNISAADFIANPTAEKLAKLLDDGIVPDSDGFYTLRNVPCSTKALILLPYAGGDASAFALLTKDLETLAPDLSIYYVDYLHSYKECETVAEKISELSKSKEINIYSHCAGTAVALQIINILEEKGVDISNYMAGGFIPPEKPRKRNFWSFVSNRRTQKILTSAGAPIDKFSNQQNGNMIITFRKDTDFMTEYFYKNVKPIKATTSVIISKTDLFTRNYKKSESLWRKYSNNFNKIYFIESDSHYFQTSESKTLAEKLNEII